VNVEVPESRYEELAAAVNDASALSEVGASKASDLGDAIAANNDANSWLALTGLHVDKGDVGDDDRGIGLRV
jgi:hypothetical protein